MGERAGGAARGRSNVVLLSQGSGVGGGAIIDGRLLHGHNFNTGEIGHVLVETEPARQRKCTDRDPAGLLYAGPLEAHVSGRALAAQLELARLEDAAPAQLERAREVSVQYAGRVLGNFVQAVGADMVVITGNAGLALGEPYAEALQQSVGSYSPTFAFSKGSVVRAEPGEYAPALGVAATAWQELDVNITNAPVSRSNVYAATAAFFGSQSNGEVILATGALSL